MIQPKRLEAGGRRTVVVAARPLQADQPAITPLVSSSAGNEPHPTQATIVDMRRETEGLADRVRQLEAQLVALQAKVELLPAAATHDREVEPEPAARVTAAPSLSHEVAPPPRIVQALPVRRELRGGISPRVAVVLPAPRTVLPILPVAALAVVSLLHPVFLSLLFSDWSGGDTVRLGTLLLGTLLLTTLAHIPEHDQ